MGQDKSTKPRIIFIDLETSPVLVWIWKTGKQVIRHDQIKTGQKPGIICICYKWAHEKKIRSLDWGINKQDSASMLDEFEKVLKKADIIVAHNGDNFDIKQINTHRLLNGQTPLSWPTSEDTLKQFRKHFYFPSYSLDYLSKVLTGTGKSPMGFQDWIDIVEFKDPTALEKMIKYCKRDVRKLSQIYEQAMVHLTHKAHAGLIVGTGKDACPRCGSTKSLKDGVKYLRQGVYQRRQCKECGSRWVSSRQVKAFA